MDYNNITVSDAGSLQFFIWQRILRCRLDDSHALSGSLDTSLFANFVGQSGEMTAILKQLFPDVAPCNLNHKSPTVSRRFRLVHRHLAQTGSRVYKQQKQREKNEVTSFCHLT